MNLKVLMIFSLLSIQGCQKNKINYINKATVTDCFHERKTIETRSEIDGTVILVAESYLLESKHGKERFSPCYLDDEYKVEGLGIRFTLLTKEIYPNERLMGTPCVITNIEKSKQ